MRMEEQEKTVNTESEETSLPEELLMDGTIAKERIGFSRPKAIAVIALAATVVLANVLLVAFLPRSEGHVVINEVMTSNDEAFVHPEYGSVDWVELYNPTSAAVDLSGFGLTDELKKQYKYTFPEGTVLEGGAYLVLYCTGGTTATDADPYCTGFALSQEGETLYLVDSRYLEIDECRIPSIPTDFSYARTDEGTYRATKVVTPGAPNRFSD